MVNIGKEIREEIHRQERSVAWFARKLGIRRTSAYDIFNKQSIDTAQLLLICRILNHNFFETLANDFECRKSPDINV